VLVVWEVAFKKVEGNGVAGEPPPLVMVVTYTDVDPPGSSVDPGGPFPKLSDFVTVELELVADSPVLEPGNRVDVNTEDAPDAAVRAEVDPLVPIPKTDDVSTTAVDVKDLEDSIPDNCEDDGAAPSLVTEEVPVWGKPIETVVLTVDPPGPVGAEIEEVMGELSVPEANAEESSLVRPVLVVFADGCEDDAPGGTVSPEVVEAGVVDSKLSELGLADSVAPEAGDCDSLRDDTALVKTEDVSEVNGSDAESAVLREMVGGDELVILELPWPPTVICEAPVEVLRVLPGMLPGNSSVVDDAIVTVERVSFQKVEAWVEDELGIPDPGLDCP